MDIGPSNQGVLRANYVYIFFQRWPLFIALQHPRAISIVSLGAKTRKPISLAKIRKEKTMA